MVPDLVSWEWAKAARKGRARLDYTQNTYIKTLVAPYAVRPAAGAPVSAPIRWDELDDPVAPPEFVHDPQRDRPCRRAGRPVRRRADRPPGAAEAELRPGVDQEHLDPADPLHPVEPAPIGDDESERRAVAGGKGRSGDLRRQQASARLVGAERRRPAGHRTNDDAARRIRDPGGREQRSPAGRRASQSRSTSPTCSRGSRSYPLRRATGARRATTIPAARPRRSR